MKFEIKMYEASFYHVVLRFYALMGLVIFFSLVGPAWGAILALPTFLIALWGPAFHLSFSSKVKPVKSITNKNATVAYPAMGS